MSYILDLRLFDQPCAWVIWSDPCSNAITHRLFTDCLWEKGMCNTGAPELPDLPAEDQQTNTPLTNHLCHQLISLWKNCSLHHVDKDFYPLLSRKGNPTNVHLQTVTWKSCQLCSREAGKGLQGLQGGRRPPGGFVPPRTEKRRPLGFPLSSRRVCFQRWVYPIQSRFLNSASLTPFRLKALQQNLSFS